MISVIMGVYNAERTLERAVRSLNATDPIEIICVDDASTDKSAEVLDKLKTALPIEMTVIKNESNMGLAYCLNKALEVAKFNFIARMDADDISHPKRLDIQKKFLDDNPAFAFVGSAARLFDREGLYGVRRFGVIPSVRDFAKGNPFIHPSLMFRREALDKVGGYDDSAKCRRCEDYDLVLRLYANDLIGCNLKPRLIDFYEARGTVKHTRATRWNEYRVRKRGYKEAKIPWNLRAYRFKPILLGLLPNRIYKHFHAKKIEKI